MSTDPYEREAAKAAIHTLQRDLERARREAKDWEEFANDMADKLNVPRGSVRKYVGSAISNRIDELIRADLELMLLQQDTETIREIITKGGSVDDIIKFLNTPSA